MKRDLKRGFRALLALLLTLALITPSIPIYAVTPGSNSSANGGKGHTGVFNVHAPGVIITVQRVTNNLSQSDKDKVTQLQEAEEKTGANLYYDQQTVAVVDQFLGTIPDFAANLNTSNAALIVRTSNSKMSEAKAAEHTMVNANGSQSGDFGGVYYVNRYASSSSFTLDVVSSKILADKDLKDLFVGQKLEWNKISNLFTDSKLSGYAESFAKIFCTTESAADYLKKLIASSASTPDEQFADVKAKYLDVLILYDYMRGDKSYTTAKSYLTTLNTDKSHEFLVMFVIPAVSMSYDDVWERYSLTSFYGFISGKGATAFQNITVSGGNAGVAALSQTTSATAYSTSLQQKFYNAIEGKFSQPKSSGNASALASYRRTLWWSSSQGTDNAAIGNFGTACSFMPTDIHGRMTGTLGFTYFSDNGYIKYQDTPSFSINLSSESETDSVAIKDDVAAATVEISLSADDAEKSNTEKWFNANKGKKITLNFVIMAKKDKGEGENATFFDTFSKSPEFEADDDKGTATAAVELKSYKEFAKWLEGEKKVTFMDKEIHIADETKNRYSVYAWLACEGDTEAPYVGKATGELTAKQKLTINGKTIDPGDTKNEKYNYDNIAGDIQEWTLGDFEGSLHLDASTENEEILEGDTTEAEIRVSLNSTEEDQKAIQSLFDKAKKEDKDVSVTFTFWGEQIAGSGANEKFIDEVVSPTNWKTSLKYDAATGLYTRTISPITKSQFMKYLDGSKTIVFKDKDIEILDETTVAYRAKVQLTVEGDTFLSVYLTAKGEQTELEEEQVRIAKDEVTWTATENTPPSPTPTPIPESHYYSKMEEPYVEIKEGTPGNETFEAMAGVPTTEMLYVGFGATEFMTNFEAISKVNPDTEREYTLTYTVQQCGGTDENCVYSCPGHKVTFDSHNICPGPHSGKYHSCPMCGGGSATVYCNKPGTYTYRSSEQGCPGHVVTVTNDGKSYSISVTGGSVDIGGGTYFGAGHQECLSKIDQHYVGSGEGCMHEAHLNTCHTHEHTYVGTVKQKINSFNYVDIKALDLWQLTLAQLVSQPILLWNPVVDIDPQTGYAAFYDQEEYINGNGRLDFSFRWNDDERYGNTQTRKDDGEVQLEADGDQAATDWMNDTVASGQTVTMTVIDDYVVLTTTEGYQVPMYYDFKAHEDIVITDTEFSNTPGEASQSTKTRGTAYTPSGKKTSKEVQGNDIYFDEIPAWDEQIAASAMDGHWGAEGIVRSGYNGNYADYNHKWENETQKYVLSDEDPQAWLTEHPNTDIKEGLTAFSEDGFTNLRLTATGVDILDSTNVVTKEWSDEDALEPVSNGVWDTGLATVLYPKVIAFNTTSGYDWGKAREPEEDGRDVDTTDAYQQYVGYTKGQKDINDIVIYDPVSTQDAIVICNDKQYDLRTETSLAEGGDPPETIIPGCPLDDSCEYAVLTCTSYGEIHTDECFEEVVTGKQHVGGYNVHVCDDACNAVHVHTEACYSTKHTCITCNGTGRTEGFVGWKELGSTSGTGTCSICGATVRYGSTTLECSGCGKRVTYGGASGCEHAGGYGAYPTGGCGNADCYAERTCTACDGKGYTEGEKTLVCGQVGVIEGHTHTDDCYEGDTTSCPTCNGSGEYWTHWYNGSQEGCLGCGYVQGTYPARGGCTNVGCPRCGGSGVIDGRNLICGKTETAGGVQITLPYTMPNGVVVVYELNQKSMVATLDPTHQYRIYEHQTGCTYAGYKHLYDVTAGKCLGCTHSCQGTILGEFSGEDLVGSCTHKLNAHQCTAECSDIVSSVLVCTDPHHHLASEPWDRALVENHYTFGDSRCWSPCGDDSKHIPAKEVTLGNGQLASTTDTFINIDREFRIYFPDIGDFAQNPTLHGIEQVSMQRGMGYTDRMNTIKWVRNKYVTFPVNTLWYSASGESQSFAANELIDLNTLEYDEGGYGYYTFYCVLGNKEAMNAMVEFDAIAVNAEEVPWYRENLETRNLIRGRNYDAKHTAYKTQYIDIVGSIGSLTLNDTGDFRFSTLFKQALDTQKYGWLIENIVPKVDYTKPNKVLTDAYDVRHEIAGAETEYHDTYGSLYQATGGKGHPTGSLPLTLADCILPSVQNQYLKPGYKLYMDIQTIGDYYGENRNQEGKLQDSNLYYKMQITPRYWELDLGTGVYTPVDVYYGVNNTYRVVTKFNDPGVATDWYYYVDWTEEADRRNYTSAEKAASLDVQKWMSPALETFDKLRLPLGKDVIGTAARLFLNDMNRTFVGMGSTYGVDRNPQGKFDETLYENQAQRWHFTLGLPSSSVFVYADQACSTENIEELKSHNAVIVCALDVKVKGEVWTLEYDGTAINSSDGGGVQVEKNGKVYPVPVDPATGRLLDDPIVAVYDNKFTAADDLKTEGSH